MIVVVLLLFVCMQPIMGIVHSLFARRTGVWTFGGWKARQPNLFKLLGEVETQNIICCHINYKRTTKEGGHTPHSSLLTFSDALTWHDHRQHKQRVLFSRLLSFRPILCICNPLITFHTPNSVNCQFCYRDENNEKRERREGRVHVQCCSGAFEIASNSSLVNPPRVFWPPSWKLHIQTMLLIALVLEKRRKTRTLQQIVVWSHSLVGLFAS